MSAPECPFCSPDPARVIHRGELALALWDAFPVARGHALIVPARHVASWFDLTPAEHAEILAILRIVRQRVEGEIRPDGFNIGFNDGRAAGQTIFHVHVHLIPRVHGDVPDPTGGVRHVIPARANYLAGEGAGRVADGAAVMAPARPATLDLFASAAARAGSVRPSPERERALAENCEQIFLPRLLRETDRCDDIDLAVAFILTSGLNRIYAHLQERLERRGRIRILTGDYLDLTDPLALRRLLDLGDKLELRVFETQKTSFHPKAYIFRSADGTGTAYVGSSNLTASALADGVEWNYRVDRRLDPAGFAEIGRAFEALFQAQETREVTPEWIDTYERRRRPATVAPVVDVAPEAPEPPPEPHTIQREAQAALDATRADGNTAGLVVLATGLGKTYLAAFDSREYRKILFVAHREEILKQAQATFRRIRPTARLGLYTGQEKTDGADILFASIQTLSRVRHLRTFAPDAFDYIVVDEFHHASAATYRKLIAHFTPKFLLGLTATPERTDGGDLLGLCQENLVYRCDFVRGIEGGWLCPFKYHGVPDEVDYSNIPWRGMRFDEEALTQAVATRARAQNAFEQYRKHGGRRALGFCCSQSHANFMAAFFRDRGVRAAAVHVGATSAPRAGSLEELQSGELEIVFAVDMFNEGVDLPNVDTVMMLRPTESSVLWTQQFGRGLRCAEGKSHLSVIDYIGNHRIFLLKLRTLLEPILGTGGLRTDADVAHALKQAQERTLTLPAGCEVTYELEAIDLIRSLLGGTSKAQAAAETIRVFYKDFRERNGVRPTAGETRRAGYNPRALRREYGAWFRFVDAMEDARDALARLLRTDAARFLEELESTPMTRSFKMVVLQAMLESERFPGSMTIAELTRAVRRIASRRAPLREDFGEALENDKELEASLVKNPVAAWTGGAGTGGTRYFAYEGGVFSSSVPGVPSSGMGQTSDKSDAASDTRRAFCEAVQELVEWRLAEYLDRPVVGDGSGRSFVCKVSHANGRPILFLPDREKTPGVPMGTTRVLADGEVYEADFVRIAVNVMRRPGGSQSELPGLMRRWFGADAGLPGTWHRVVFREPRGGEAAGDAAWVLEAVNEA